ncbi:MAG: ribonuclease P protein component 1 [Candidatus Aenigmarchaeota archaeon]|nr:ribonuclease P protein component 1 [Candidatus Aenigmarchaeota archaeon]
MRNASNILRHELIGLNCKITGSNNKSQVGIEGKIVDETMKTIILQDGGRKTIEKQGTTFRIEVGGKKVDVDGNFLVSRPEDRIKKKITKW